MPALMGAGVKPLAMSQMPRDASQVATGRVAMKFHTEICS
jgi:hypothetical protein